MTATATVGFLVSGHGFGHAVRAACVGRALVRRGARVHFRTDADAAVFDGVGRVHPAEVDVGVRQHDCLRVDERRTLDELAAFWDGLAERTKREADALRALAVDVVACDIAPLGVVAARELGVPAVVVANFTWDRILRPWADRDRRADRLADELAAVYADADVTVVTAPDCGVARAADSRAVGAIVRTAARPRAELRRELGLLCDQVGVLVAFGGFGPPPLPPPVDTAPERFRFFGYADLGWPASLYRRVSAGALSHPELVRAADVLLGKPGYGTVVECARHGTPMLWVGRARFAETVGLEAAIRDYVGGVELGEEARAAGRLGGALEAALSSSPRRGRLDADGAEQAAACILAAAG